MPSFQSSDLGVYPFLNASEFDATVRNCAAQGGGTVLLPPKTLIGRWNFSDLSAPVTIAGIPGVSVLKWPDHTGYTMINNSDSSENRLIKPGANFTLRDFVLDGNKANQTAITTNEGCMGVYIRDKDNVKFIGLEIKNMVHGGAAVNNCNDFLFERCHIHDSHNTSVRFPTWDYEHPMGILVYNVGKTGRVINCWCIDNGLDGLGGELGSITIMGGKYNGNGKGFTGGLSGNAQPYTGQTVGAGGIYGMNMKDAVISGVIANGNTETGIQVKGSKIAITGCVCDENLDAGLMVQDGSVITMTGNICCDNGGWASSHNRDTGLYVMAGNNIVASNNICNETRVGAARKQYYGIRVETTAYGIGNRCTGNTSLDYFGLTGSPNY